MPKTSVTTSLIAAALLAGCASGRGSGATTTTVTPTGTGAMVASTTTLNSARKPTTTTSGGDVDMANGGLQPADISRMNNANILAHLAAGDSLEVQLSRTVLAHAQNPSVRNFAQRMINEHTQHMQQGRQLAMQSGITPTPAPGDTLDVLLATRTMSGSMSDRQAMGAEVAMHRHMLHELTMLQPQATGAARTLIDQTIPIVRRHLTDAESIWRQVGGGNGRNGTR